MRTATLSLAAILLLSQLPAVAQQPNMAAAQQALWQKSKTQRTVGFVLLGAGAILTVAGFAAGTNDVFASIVQDREPKGTGAMIAGLSLMAGSVPLFIMAGKNRQAALRLSALPTSSGTNPPRYCQPGLQLQLTFTQNLFSK